VLTSENMILLILIFNYCDIRYSVERSNNPNGDWVVVCDQCVTDFELPWIDNTQPSTKVYYRVRGFNLDGKPGPYSPIKEN